jgi:hypothetical protein
MRLRIAMLAVASVAVACSVDRPTSSTLNQDGASASAQADPTAEAIEALGNSLNAQLEAEGASYRVAQAEWLNDDVDNGENVLLFGDVGNKKLDADWVPGDPRRGGRTNITYRINDAGGQAGSVTPAQSSPAIDRAMATWNGVNCSVIPITKLPGYAGPFSADITHNGWVTGLPPGVLGVTFTFIFIAGPGGPPTDIDNNKYADVAARPIFYGQRPDWRINANIDVETVVLHEAGHGLSQAHFGKLFATTSNEKFHFAPRAVMNAGYTGVQQTIGDSDNAGHCANWANWPNN